MDSSKNKFVRFQDWSSERSSSSERQIPAEDGLYLRKNRKSISSALKRVRRGFESGSERIKSFGKPLGSRSPSDWPAKELGSQKKILDPQGPFLQRWNKIFVFSCVIAVSMDPLFFYIPVINRDQNCLGLDDSLKKITCVLRSFIDIFYILHIIFQFHTGFIAPSSRVFGRGELIEDRLAIMKRYLSSYFIIDVLSILPLPQVALLVIVPSLKFSVSLATKELLKYIVFSQYVPRLIRIYPLYEEVKTSSGILTETAWAGAALNLILYMLAGHIVGAFWYLFSVDRQDSCWRDAFSELRNASELTLPRLRDAFPKLNLNYTELYCGEGKNNSFLNAHCDLNEPDKITNSTVFDFGIFLDALKSGVADSESFRKKFFYCFWWGLRGLSSLGQNLKTSTFVLEIIFAVFISIFGLFLFSLLIGNMQQYLQSTTVRIEEMRVKRQDAEHWMSHRMLPENLKERIRRYEQYKWQENRGVEEETLIQNLPKDLRRDLKRHLCLDLLMRVPMFEKMDEQLLDAMCDHLKPVLYTEKSFIAREGDPVDEMLFIMRGNLLTMTTNGGKTGFFNSVYLNAGDFCGDELLTWALDPNSSSILPTSTRTVVAQTEVEAFALKAYDLKLVASQFRRLQSKKIQHTFKFHSQQWRTWAACFIQVAWRQYCKRKLEKSLQREEEDRLQDALAKEVGTSSPSLGTTIYASKFAANLLQTLRHNVPRNTKLSPRLLPLLPQKPAEPDFTSQDR